MRTIDAITLFPVLSSQASLRVDVVSEAVRYSFFIDPEPISARIAHMSVTMTIIDSDDNVTVKKFDIVYRVPPTGLRYLGQREDPAAQSLLPVKALLKAFTEGTLV